ncbi:Acetyltransferase (GNAT) family protein [Muriicola jejuensis]|nr:Acetyltransferase (GNAT) family protein [Muriicola jejuensis]
MEVLVRISRQTFSAAFEAQNDPVDFQLYLDTALSGERLLSELKDPLSHFYFVYLRNDLVGFFKYNEGEAQTDLKDARAIELERIYVLPEYQKMGIGKGIIKEVVQKAIELGKDYIWLGVWEENLKALSFYEGLGFIKFGKHPYFIGKDKQMDWLMKLHLTTL